MSRSHWNLSFRPHRRSLIFGLASIGLALPVVLTVASSSPAANALAAGLTAKTAAAADAASVTNTGPVFQTQAFAYRPGVGLVNTSSLPTEATYQTGGATGEGQVQVASNGDIFEYSPSTGVLRSTDGGLTWLNVQPPVSTPACAGMGSDHTIWTGAGRLFLTASSSPKVNFSDDNGTTWSATCGAQAPGAEESWNADRANIFGGPPSAHGAKPTTSYPDVLYYCGQSVRGNDTPGTFWTLCEVSLDGGVTWTNANQPVFTEPLNGCDAVASASMPGPSRPNNPWTPDINWGSVGPDGTVYIAKNFCGQPTVAMSTNNGNTWTRVSIPDSKVGILSGNATQYGGYEEGVTADRQGDVFFSWIGANDKPYLSVSRNHGRTWSQPIMYAAPGVNTAFWPFMSIDSHGNLDLMYMGTSGSGYTDATANWFEYVAEVTNPASSGSHPLIYSATTTPSSYPWLVGAGGPDRAPDNCGCDYVSVAAAPNGNAVSLTYDNNTMQLGALVSVLSAPPGDRH